MKNSVAVFFSLIFMFNACRSYAQTKDSVAPRKLMKQQQEAINAALLQARKCIANHQWDEAEDAYSLALKYDSSNLTNYLEFVSWLKERNKYRQILLLSEKLLPFYKRHEANDQTMKKGTAVILELMGESRYYQSDNIAAEKELKEAVKILNQLSEKSPQLFLLDVAAAQKNLGRFYAAISDFENAETYLTTALNNAKKSATWNSVLTGCEMASINIALGNMHFKRNDFENAKVFYSKALEINDTSSVDCLSPYPDNVAVARKGLAKIYEQLHDSLSAEKFYKEAIEFYEAAFPASREHYIDKITASLEDLVKFYDYKISKANFYWSEKLFNYHLLYYKIYNLEKDYTSEIADLYNDFGNDCMEINEFKKADSIYTHGLQLYRKRSQYEENYKTRQVIALTNLGQVNDHLKDYAKAESYRIEALKLCESVYEDSSETDADICLFTQSDLAGLYLVLMDSVRSDLVFQKFSQTTEALYNQMQSRCTTPNNNMWQEPCSPSVCGTLSYYLLFLKKFPEAETVARWALERDSSQPWIKCNLAHALLFQDKYESAKQIYLDIKPLTNDKGLSYAQLILKDFEQLERNNITNDDVNKIRKILEK